MDRFWSKVQYSPGCWLWLATRSDGYGTFYLDGRMQKAHRVAYELLVGSIPEGRQLDHLCRVRHCVWPEHLEPVTQAENIRRGKARAGSIAYQNSKTHCPKEHEYDEKNTMHHRRPNGKVHRECAECNRVRSRTAKAEERKRLRGL